jgi:hypothetical protein
MDISNSTPPLVEPGAARPTGEPAPDAAPSAAPASGAPVKAIVGVALVTVIAGALSMLMLTRRPATIEGPAAAAPAAAPSITRPLAPARADVASPSEPKWIPESGWAADRSRMTTFWLDAENPVGIWMKRVRPTLSVRCSGRSLEVFVVASAASIESSDGLHTVRLRFDEGGELVERWAESDDRQALFAADGPATARRIAGAGTVSFGFTPYNASPVVARFDVRGLSDTMAKVSKTCSQQVSPASSPRRGSSDGPRASR